MSGEPTTRRRWPGFFPSHRAKLREARGRVDGQVVMVVHMLATEANAEGVIRVGHRGDLAEDLNVPGAPRSACALLFSGREVNRWLARRQQAVAPRGGRKLGEAEVAEIRRLLAKGVARRDLAARYRVSAATIAHLASGRTWKGVS